MKGRAKKSLGKKAKKGFRGYPVATVALYGPTDEKATKLVVGIVLHEGAEPDEMRKWHSAEDIRKDLDLYDEVLEFIKSHEVRSVAMTDRIIGCPHEEGIDYPDGESCPECPFWHGRDRFSGEFEH
jgi:hypothetical protein